MNLLVFATFLCSIGDSDQLLKPTHRGTDVGLVWVQGAASPTAGYVSVFRALAQSFLFVPHLPFPFRPSWSR